MEINDIPAVLERGESAEGFGRMITDQFDVLYEDGATSGRVMAICLHPFLIGHPYRSKYLDKALAHITSRSEVWLVSPPRMYRSPGRPDADVRGQAERP